MAPHTLTQSHTRVWPGKNFKDTCLQFRRDGERFQDGARLSFLTTQLAGLSNSDELIVLKRTMKTIETIQMTKLPKPCTD